MNQPDWLHKFKDAKEAKDGWACKCSAHEDDKQSLSVYMGDDNRWHIHCHAGCNIKDILKGAGLKIADIIGQKKVSKLPSRIVATYDYTDEAGKLLFQAVRFAPKDFRQRQPAGGGKWTWNLKGVRLVPYRLPEIIAADTVYIVEGEKDVETLRKHGKTATCNPMGAGKWRAEFSKFLEGKTVIILPDNDKPGREHAGKVLKSVEKLAASAKIIDVPDGKDITEYLDGGGNLADLEPKQQVAKPGDEWRLQYNPYQDTHMGNAERLIKIAGADLRYSKHSGWFVWTGNVWAQESDRIAEIYKTRVIPSIYAEAGQSAGRYDALGAKILANWAKRSESAAVMKASVDMASTAPEIRITNDQLDRDPMILNTIDGKINLNTGRHEKHDRRDLITRLAPVKFSASAKCPRWLQFLHEIFPQGPEMIDWIQRAAGYCLTASVAEQVMFFATGCGKNGKSVFINTLMSMLGTYACETPTDTLMAKHSGQGGIANDLARLPGVRFVSANETEHGQRLAEAKIKGMTGGDTITARFLHKEFFDFKPVFKLWLRSNHKPVIKGTDEGIWRRIRLIPFIVNFEGREDRALPEKLQAELPGILQWAVEGCLMWQQRGLDMPCVVATATQQYRSSQDTIGLFLDERTLSGPDFVAHHTRASDLYKTFTEWCEEAGERPVSQRKLAEAMLERGFKRFLGGAEWSYRWIGLVLKSKVYYDN